MAIINMLILSVGDRLYTGTSEHKHGRELYQNYRLEHQVVILYREKVYI